MLTLEQVQQAGGYSVIYADPPWGYSDTSCNGGIGFEYNGMSLDELALMPIEKLASKNCLLFMWCTWPFLFEGLALGRLWGFEFLSKAFVWLKMTQNNTPHRGGLGRWVRGNTEFCLLFRRGRMARAAKDVQELIRTEIEGEVLEAERTRHSEKPPEVRDRIVRLVGDVPRIELFARQRVQGWDAHGNDPAIGESDVCLT